MAKSKTAAKKSTKSKSPAAKSQSVVVERPDQPGVERRRNHPLRAKDGYMRVILTGPVAHIGQTGDLVKVRPGFARNYLLPQGLATFATPHNLRIIEQHRERLRKIEEAKRADLVNIAAQISRQEIMIHANANEEGHLYGSVNADQIAAALREHHYPIEEAHVKLEGPIKEMGQFQIRIQLAPDIEGMAHLWVVPLSVPETQE